MLFLGVSRQQGVTCEREVAAGTIACRAFVHVTWQAAKGMRHAHGVAEGVAWKAWRARAATALSPASPTKTKELVAPSRFIIIRK